MLRRLTTPSVDKQNQLHTKEVFTLQVQLWRSALFATWFCLTILERYGSALPLLLTTDFQLLPSFKPTHLRDFIGYFTERELFCSPPSLVRHLSFKGLEPAVISVATWLLVILNQTKR